MGLKLALSNWRDKRAVERADRRKAKAEGTTIVVRQPMNIPAMMSVGWKVTKIGAMVYGGWWVYSHVPSLSWISGGMSAYSQAAEYGRAAKETAGGAFDAFGHLAQSTGRSIGDGAAHVWNRLPSFGGSSSDDTARGNTSPKKYAAPPTTPSSRQEQATIQIPSQSWVEKEVAARRKAADAEERRRGLAELEAEARRLKPTEIFPVDPPRKTAPPDDKGFFSGPAWESKTPAEHADFHWRGRSIHSATPGWTIAPCGDRRGSTWVHVQIGTQEGPPNCRFYETRYFASELPSPETAKRTYLAIDDGWYWQTAMTSQGRRWVLTKMRGWKGQEAVRSVDLTPDQQRQRWGLSGQPSYEKGATPRSIDTPRQVVQRVPVPPNSGTPGALYDPFLD